MKKKSYSLKLQYNSPVVLTFALACLGVLAVSWLAGDRFTRLLFCVYRAPLTDPLTYPRMILHVLGHSGYDHFLANMTLLLVIGPPLEERYGSEKLLWCILITALVSGLVQFIFFPGSALMGASGIVFMMILLASLSGMSKGHIPLTFLLVAAIYLGDEVIAAITQRDNISQLTHIVGGLCGGALGMSMRRK